MQTKLKLFALLLSLIVAITPFTYSYANAQTFDLRIPSFGLHCENKNAGISGKIKYVIDESGNAVQYSEYFIEKTDGELNLYLPFVSTAVDLPETVIAVNGIPVTRQIFYGERYPENYGLRFYPAETEDISGTLYTVTATSENVTVNFTTYDKQSFIYLFPVKRAMQSGNSHSLMLDNARPADTYEIYSLRGEFESFESNAETVKQTLTVNEYINRYIDNVKEYYSPYYNITPDLLYSLINRALDRKIDYKFDDFFYDSFLTTRLNAYKITVKNGETPCTVTCSAPVKVQCNKNFNPAIFMAEQTATGNYRIDYTVELNEKLPFVIESSTKLEKQDDYVYTAKNVTNDFYFVFSSLPKPENIYGDDGKNKLTVVLLIALTAVVCVLLASGIFIFVRFKKRTKI